MERVKQNRDWKSHLGNWGIYAAAAGASLSMATSADAGIISGTLNLSKSITGGATSNVFTAVSFAIDGALVKMGVGNIGAHVSFGGMSTPGGQFCSSFGGPRPGCQSIQVPRRGDALLEQVHSSNHLNFFKNHSSIGARRYLRNSVIAGGALSHSQLAILDSDNGGVKRDAVPFGTTNDFIGFKAPNGDLGWLQIEVLDRNGDGYADQIKAIAYGYNTVAGASIEAGQTSSAPATPEPGTASLALLAAGAAGIVALRKARAKA
jgi:hypothetical protein